MLKRNLRNKFTSVLALIFFFLVSTVQAEGLSPQDYMEIEQLYAKYNWAIDAGDAEGYADTFVDDGVFNNFTGREALVGFINRFSQGDNGGTRRHWNTNLKIEGDGKTASGAVYLMLMDVSTKPASIVTMATYSDKLIKTENGWRFSQRITQADPAPEK